MKHDLLRGNGLARYPQFTSVSPTQDTNTSSWYQALTLSATRRFSGGLQYLISYTWSKYLAENEGAETWASGSSAPVNFYDRSLEKSVSSNDIPHSLVVSYIYELPIGKGKPVAPSNPVVNAVIGGWQVAGIHTFKSGLPLFFSAANNANTFGGGQRPILVGNPSVPNPTVDRWFNTEAFAQPAAFTIGNVPRTTPYLRSDGYSNSDFTLSKNWYFLERFRAQLRGEFFNFLNQTNFYRPNTNLTSPGFGRVTSAYAPRSIQFGLKVYW